MALKNKGVFQAELWMSGRKGILSKHQLTAKALVYIPHVTAGEHLRWQGISKGYQVPLMLHLP